MIISWGRVIAVVALVAGIGFLVHSYNSAIEGRVKAEKERDEKTEALNKANADLSLARRDASRLEKALETRRDYAHELETQKAARDLDKQAARTDPVVRDWLSTPIPERLRNGAKESGTGPGLPALGGAGRSDPNSSAAVAGPAKQ